MLDNVDGLRAAAEAGDAIFGNIDTWVIWNLTGGSHVTDVTNASRTMLMNLETLDWDEEILEIMGIPRSMLPKIVPSSDPNTWGNNPGRRPIRRRNPGLRRPGRPASGDGRPGLPQPRRSQEHLWHRLLHDHEHRYRRSFHPKAAC